MFTEERREKIYQLIRKNKRTNINELVALFKVSGTTIRTDLATLEKAGLILRTHGGALLQEDFLYQEDSITARLDQNLVQKQRIAQAARALIKKGDTILLDSGTTNLELAKCLYDAKDLTVVTNDLKIALELQKIPGIYLLVLGGRVRNFFECTVGNMAMKYLDDLSVDKAFITTNALSITKGATTPSIENAEVKEAMMKIADKLYLIFDSSKIGKRTNCTFGRITSFDTIITDDGAPKDIIEKIEKMGPTVILC